MSARKPPAEGDFTEATVSTRRAYEGSLIKVNRDEVRLPDGHIAWREYVLHPGAVMMLAFRDERTVILERQFRYPKRRHFIELPAGKLEIGEDPLECAKRELIEECGYEAGEWRRLAQLDPCVGYSDEVIHLYAARDLKHVGANLDQGEHLETFEASIDEAIAWIGEGLITDTKTVFALLWWERFGSAASSAVAVPLTT